MNQALADGMLLTHLGFVAWVLFGALVTRARPLLAALHIASVIYGIVAELGPWPCPLTLAENFFEARAGLGRVPVSENGERGGCAGDNLCRGRQWLLHDQPREQRSS